MSAPKIVHIDRPPEANLAWFDLPLVGSTARRPFWLPLCRDALAIVGLVSIVAQVLALI